ncbi:MAG: Gldg family protein, partial [Planctomycetes bacterium]|nr:Gldg family protein [Planctomycetota bacterium]
IGLAILNVVLFNLIMSPARRLRIDLTEGQVYSLSPVTERLLGNLDEEVRISAYFSSPENLPEPFRPLVPELDNLLAEYESVGNGMVRLERVTPEDDAVAEKKASEEFGIEPRPFIFRDARQQGVRSFYFAIVVEYASSRFEKIGLDDLIETNVFDAQEPRIELKNVEYALTRAIKKSVFGFEGQRDLFSKLKYQVKISTFVTNESELPELVREVPATADKVLTELAEKSGGKLTYEKIEVPADKEARTAKARQLRLRTIPLPGEKDVYLWALMDLDGETITAIPLVNADGGVTEFALRELFEGFLRRITPGILRTVGIMQAMPADMDPRMAQMGQPMPRPPFFDLSRRLEEDYEIHELDFGRTTSIPPEIDVLLVMAPSEVPEQAQYAIDQYVMRGGRTIICADRNRVEVPQLGRLETTAHATGLEDLLAHWGLSLSEEVVFDPKAAGQFPWDPGASTPGARRSSPKIYDWPTALLVGDLPEGVHRDSALVASFEVARFWFPSAITIEEKDGIDAEWLLRSSEASWLSRALDPNFEVFRDFGYAEPNDEAAREARTLSVLLKGRFGSLYENRPVPQDKPTATDGEATDEPASTGLTGAPLIASPDATRVLVIANDDLVDALAADTANWGAPLNFYSYNLRFVRNAIDWMLEDDDLLTIRNRGRSYRPLQALEAGEQRTIRWLNFLLPAGLVLALGLGLYFIRQNRRSLVG